LIGRAPHGAGKNSAVSRIYLTGAHAVHVRRITTTERSDFVGCAGVQFVWSALAAKRAHKKTGPPKVGRSGLKASDLKLLCRWLLGQQSHSSLGLRTRRPEPEEGSQRQQPAQQRYRHKEPGSKLGQPERSKPERSSSERSNRSSGEHADEPTGRSTSGHSSCCKHSHRSHNQHKRNRSRSHG
jgi:hypothetical protein